MEMFIAIHTNVAGISTELRTVIKLMMEPNASVRPTASMLLDHPIMQQVLRERVIYDRIENVVRLQ